MNILVTGAKGFIGSHLMKALSSHNVIGIDNLSHPSGNSVKTEWCDVRYVKGLLPYFQNCDIVFHLAAQINVDKSITDPEETIATNITGTQNILQLAKRFGTKVIFASTSEIYGSSQTEFMSESHPLDPQSPYGASKAAADRLCYSYFRTFDMDVSIVRNFNTFGTFQNDDSYGGVIAKFTKAAIKNEPLYIFGDGKQERDYMFVDDAVEAYKTMMSAVKGSVVNFGSGKTVSINDLAGMIKGITKSSSPIEHTAPRPGEVGRLCADITKARALGFDPKTDFEKDLASYIRWYKER